MKMIVKKLLLGILAAGSLIAVVWCGTWCSAQKDVSLCENVCIEIHDSLLRQYVDTDELVNYMKREGIYPLGKNMDAVDCHVIEESLHKHDMVRNVECYKSSLGELCIGITQRVPVLYVLSNEGCYYVDSDRRIMPVRKQIKEDVPVFKGAVSKRAACEEYYDFVEWLSDDSYWRERVNTIYVSNPKHIVLYQKEPEAKIILGSLDGYALKMAKLRKLYTKGAVLVDSIGYSEYDLRYNGQVVAKE